MQVDSRESLTLSIDLSDQPYPPPSPNDFLPDDAFEFVDVRCHSGKISDQMVVRTVEMCDKASL